jgi:N4-gp56 family major capsid protein
MATTYGDISPRTAAYAAKELLKRGIPFLVIEKFGQAKALPANNSKVMKFRRYNALSTTPATLTEGVTPSESALTHTDVTATLVQYGDRVIVSDVVEDTHEDPVLQEATEILGEQAAQMIEKVRYGVLKAGTNILYANGTARTDVNTPLSLTLVRRAVRTLKRQNARSITSVVKSTPAFDTASCAPAFVAMIHPDCATDVRNIPGFQPAEKYTGAWENEIGKVEDVRFVESTIFEPFADGGGAKAGSGTTMLSTTGTSADVYPVLVVGKDAYGIVALKGAYAITPMVVNAKPSDSDPMAQRSHVAWKTMQTAVILNDAWMLRVEVAATA